MNSESTGFIASLVNTVNDLNKFDLSRDYRRIRPDITASHVVSARGSGSIGGQTLAMQFKEDSKAPVDAGFNSFPKATGKEDESLDISSYLDSGSSSSGEYNAKIPLNEDKQRVETKIDNSSRIEFVEYDTQDDREFYLDPKNPQALSPIGIAQVWRELNTLSAR